MLMAMRRLDAAEAGGSLLLDARRLQQPVLIWLGELPALTPGEGWVVQPHGS